MAIDDDPYWVARMNMSSSDLAAMRDVAAQRAGAAYDAYTRANATVGEDSPWQPTDGAGVDKFASGVQAQMAGLMAQRAAQNASANGNVGWQLRGRIAPPLPGHPPPGCVALPLAGAIDINSRKPEIGQGDGRFGTRRQTSGGLIKPHQGVDLTAPAGTEVFAAHSGRITKADASDPSYGNRIRLDGDHGLATRYAHLSEILVNPGQRVDAGQLIGKTGVTGNAAHSATRPGGDPHLHFEVLDNGKPVDPFSKLCPPTSPLSGREEDFQ